MSEFYGDFTETVQNIISESKSVTSQFYELCDEYEILENESKKQKHILNLLASILDATNNTSTFTKLVNSNISKDLICKELENRLKEVSK